MVFVPLCQQPMTCPQLSQQPWAITWPSVRIFFHMFHHRGDKLISLFCYVANWSSVMPHDVIDTRAPWRCPPVTSNLLLFCSSVLVHVDVMSSGLSSSKLDTLMCYTSKRMSTSEYWPAGQAYQFCLERCSNWPKMGRIWVIFSDQKFITFWPSESKMYWKLICNVPEFSLLGQIESF